ncbi:Alpha-1,3/1,6-mannosyltransferase alg-2 [Wickerhamiella sorbophila]|uniref:Alpha-1,3/1,6-mannosyltransferase ALG2 n=1 Tax=Wickerhamiella sorbophila TaxID=45607 RepID=A0A2T0FE17_9ASCO|nr:Alpha-1,3/1,6-mannosyltransferase alg-2 [Wickerhamiella sorbophila]PRT53242.1 Alpha-1,3/1,6-mannosyltransferase alg-2 [Wickerhamiella sorbophila]
MKVAFLHPDLGIGGAERLVVDSALALKNRGHEVTIFTSHHDKKHCFPETKDGSLDVVVLGNSIFPRNIFGRGAILCAVLRQLHLVEQIRARRLNFDVYVIDQLSAAIPVIYTGSTRSRILFYCHFPDLLLTERKSILKKIYRLPFDALEKWTTGIADKIVVNSEFTKGIYRDTFGPNMPEPSVLYPVVDVKESEKSNLDHVTLRQLKKWTQVPVLISINRFERKKNLELALESYSLLLHSTFEARESLLVIAGGYDERVSENVEHLAELQQRASKYRLPHKTIFPDEPFKLDKNTKVVFLPSVSNDVRNYLLENARLTLYTPTNEHFGIVPLESMKARTPVLATNTGGPLETIVDGETGFLRKPDVEEWYKVMGWAILEAKPEELKRMGDAGYARVASKFSLSTLEENLDSLVKATQEMKRDDGRVVESQLKVLQWSLVGAAVLFVFFLSWFYSFLRWFIPALFDSMTW